MSIMTLLFRQVRLSFLLFGVLAAFLWHVPVVQAGNFNAADAAQLIAILQGSVLADGDTITLTGTEYDLNGLVSGTLNLNKQITIKSGTNATLRTSTAEDFPWLGANSPVRFENITFRFLRDDAQNYTVSTPFQDVTGTGLVNNGQNLVFDNVTFDGNSFTENAISTGNIPGGNIRGGALSQLGGTMVFNGDTRFTNNRVQ